MATPGRRTRSLSPATEIKEVNKRPAVICDFFAQGWCIRGSSCRFLHIKDDLNNTTRKPEVEADALDWKKVQVNEGVPYLFWSVDVQDPSLYADSDKWHFMLQV